MLLRDPIALVLAAVTVALASAGCSTAHGSFPGAGGVLFDQSCSECHSLSGRDDPYHQGGDLLRFRSSRAQLLEFAREMPVPVPLNAAQLTAIVDYVRAVQGPAAGGGTGP